MIARQAQGILLACLAVFISGCGAFQGYDSPFTPPPADTGVLQLNLEWTGDRADPLTVRRATIKIFSGDKQVQEANLTRSDSNSTTWRASLGAGVYRLQIALYNDQQPLSSPVSSGEVTVVIGSQSVYRLTLATGGPPARLAILPSNAVLTPGQILPLSALGVDALGRYVLLPADTTLSWASSDGGTVNMGADGVARALAPGTATITATAVGSGLEASASVEVRTQLREWTILVFMNAANNLEPDSVDDMNEMEQLGSTDSVNIVVQWKRIAGYDSSNGDWRTTRRYYVTKDNDPLTVNSNLLVDMGLGVDMGSPTVLREFLQWGVRSFPARRYMVVLWNHGSGWRAYRDRWDILGRGVSFDDTTGNYIRIWELPTALSIGVQWSIIAFDASLMQMLEVAYEIRNLGEYIVGSEESPPAPGYPYHRILAPVIANPSIATREFARQIVLQTIDYYGADRTDNITQSALDASHLETVAERVDRLAQVLLTVASGNGVAVAAARENAQAYAQYTYKDLWDYTEQLRARMPSSSSLSEAINGVQAALTQTVVAEAHSNRRVNRSRGLSIYIPSPNGYETRYGLLSFARVTHWDEWLQSQPQ